MKQLLFIILILISSSCNKKTKLNLFPQETQLQCNRYPNEIESYPPTQFILCKDHFILLKPNFGDVAMIVDCKDGSTKGYWGKKGTGPDEFLNFYCNTFYPKDSTLYIFDHQQKSLRKYKQEKDPLHWNKISEIKADNDSVLIYDLHRMENGYSVANAPLGLEKPFILLDKDLNIISNFGDIKIPAKPKDLLSYTGFYASYGNKFTFVMTDLGYIAGYEITDNGKEKKLWEHYLEEPIYKEDGSIDRRKTYCGFLDIKMTKNYVFCVYSGKSNVDEYGETATTLPETILVFDHKGNPIKKFHTDKDIIRVAVSEDEKTMYCISVDPEVEIIYYDISNQLR